MRPTAVVMNMFHTGLGIARSLGERGVRVIGLSAQRGVYGNFTRYAKTMVAPDSKLQPAEMRDYLLQLGNRLGHRAIIFPTRDDDVVLLDRFRKELEPHFVLTIPESEALRKCVDKWETFLTAERAGVAAPQSWLVDGEAGFERILPSVKYPSVIKPVAAYEWRAGKNWQIVGGRKAIGIESPAQLRAEYRDVCRASSRALIQEMVPGNDAALIITACYLDRQSNWVAGFNTQKLIQEPEGFGTGCVLQSVNCPELFEPTIRLLQAMRFTGVAEVEYKRDERTGEFKLIEVNPRFWDQHRLGSAFGLDLAYMAYCEHAGLPLEIGPRRFETRKWVADDAFFATALRLLWRRSPRLHSLFHAARGKRIYGIWSLRDPLPFIGYFSLLVIPRILGMVAGAAWTACRKRFERPQLTTEERQSS